MSLLRNASIIRPHGNSTRSIRATESVKGMEARQVTATRFAKNTKHTLRKQPVVLRGMHPEDVDMQ